MSESPQPIQIEPIHLRDLAGGSPAHPPLCRNSHSEISGVDRVERVTAKAGAVLVEAGEPWHYYWLVLEGETCAKRPRADGTWTLVGICARRRRLRRSALAHRQDRVHVPHLGGAGFRAASLQRAGFLVAAGLLPRRAQNRPRRQRAAVAGLPGRGAASREARLSGHARRRPHARAATIPARPPSAPHRNSAKTCCACSSSACAAATSPRPPPRWSA